MFEEVKEMFYDEEDGLLRKLRDGRAISEEKRNALLSFAKEVKQKIKDETNCNQELAFCLEVIYSFLILGEYQDFVTKFYNILT